MLDSIEGKNDIPCKLWNRGGLSFLTCILVNIFLSELQTLLLRDCNLGIDGKSMGYYGLKAVT